MKRVVSDGPRSTGASPQEFGDSRPNSFASSFPHPRDIYLEQTWLTDAEGRLSAPMPGSTGVLVSFDECELVEFFEATPQPVQEAPSEQ